MLVFNLVYIFYVTFVLYNFQKLIIMIQKHTRNFFMPKYVLSFLRNQTYIYQKLPRTWLSIRCSSTLSSTETLNNYSDEEKVKLQRWIEMCKFEGDYMPKVITDEQFEALLCKSSFQRKKYLHYLAKREWASTKDKAKKEQQKILKVTECEERLLLNTQTHIRYGLWFNTLFSKTTERNIANLYDHRLANAMIYGQPLVLDMGFESHMAGREISSLAEQVVQAISVNRTDAEPFNLTLCNVDYNYVSMKELQKRMPNIFSSTFPMNISQESYLNLFPRERLVYLSPNARTTLTKYDPDAIYIVGGIVDLGRKEPLTLAKAKKEKIKMAKLPLDRSVL